VNGLILAIDQGTHSTRAIVFDAQGRMIAQARQPVTLHTRSHSEVEQDPDEIRRSMLQVIDRVLADPVLDGRSIGAAGLATQRSSVVAWERDTGLALAPLLSWQDRRSADWIGTLTGHGEDIAQRTGLRLSPHYGAGKLRWLLDHVPAVAAAARDGRLATGPLASYLLYHLLEEHPAVVDDANAARTLLWNLGTRDWDGELLALFGIPRTVLPACRPIRADYGLTVNGAIPLRAVNGDQTAALYALGAPARDTILVNIGTGAFVLLPADDPAPRPAGLLAGISDSDAAGGRYYLEGTVNGAGAALSWAAQRFALTDLERLLPGWLEEITAPPLFINTVGGVGAPWWIAGPEPYFEDADIAAPAAMVAVLESILFLIQANIALLCETRPGIAGIRISGGLASLDALCQKLADLSGLPVRRPPQVEATARGIAWLAGGMDTDWPASGAVATFTPRANPGLRARYDRFIGILQTLL
jgi:glycerol kinase